ncbi:phenol hydroxylase subunit P4 [Kerstersia sp.]|uniref:phenol hydroxylase subunit P4 n=1 Tax=Kerstersia sp. TaxID=1930783 RepID=UPI003F910238
MTLRTLAPYDFPPRDSVERFPAPLLYIGWDGHMSFCSPVCLPVPPETPFAALRDSILPTIYSQHPDFAQIDWDKVEWLKDGQAWQPQAERSLADNGIGHKDVIRFRTPGLTGIAGSHS